MFFSIVSESFNSHIVGVSVFRNSLCLPLFFFPFCFWFSTFPRISLYVWRHTCSVFWGRGRVGRAWTQNSCWSQIISWRLFRKFPGFLLGMTLHSSCATPVEWRHKIWAVQNHYSRGLQTSFVVYFFFFFKFLIFLFYLWLCWVLVSVLGLSLVVASGGHSSSRCAGLSLSRPLLLRSTGSRCAGSVVVAHRPSCSAACGIFPDQGSNPCPLH